MLVTDILKGQIAITEVMSSAAAINTTNLAGMFVGEGPDFWEVTNFAGTNVNLAGYMFADDSLVQRQLDASSPPLIIAPRESVVFYRSQYDGITITEADFRAWWGQCLGASVQLRPFPVPGLGSAGDQLALFDPQGRLVDFVLFGQAQRGRSFTYNPETGDLDRYSTGGECGGCAAATTDIGSPGVTCGSVPLRILEEPGNVTTCAGLPATFMVRGAGLPRPAYQWFFNGVPIAGASSARLVITNAQFMHEGDYEVDLNNGLTNIRSARVRLTIDANAAAPIVTQPPQDLEAYPGQTARFCVSACSFPAARFQWYSNGVPIAEETAPEFRFQIGTLDVSGSEFCVRVSNPLGTNTACARLRVIARPALVVTELMAQPATNCLANNDWFEVTNTGSDVVNLHGYRFYDQPVLESAAVVTERLLIRPGESVVFAEALTREQFIEWWGAENLPPCLQVVTHSRFGLDAIRGDRIRLWNAAALHAADFVTERSFAQNLSAQSLYFENSPECIDGCESIPGERGAFNSLLCADVGSPGYTTNPPPRFVSISREGASLTLRWRATAGRTYRLFWSASIPAAMWTELGDFPATNAVHAARVGVSSDSQRFFRVEEVP